MVCVLLWLAWLGDLLMLVAFVDFVNSVGRYDYCFCYMVAC